MSSTSKPKRERTEYYREYYRTHEQAQLRSLLRHYRRLMNQGRNYIPRDWTKFALLCKVHNLDALALIEGRVAAPWEKT